MYLTFEEKVKELLSCWAKDIGYQNMQFVLGSDNVEAPPPIPAFGTVNGKQRAVISIALEEK